MFQRDRNKMASSGQASRFASHLTKTGDLGLDFHLPFAFFVNKLCSRSAACYQGIIRSYSSKILFLAMKNCSAKKLGHYIKERVLEKSR